VEERKADARVSALAFKRKRQNRLEGYLFDDFQPVTA
jgi:hypothetical protein